VTLKVGQAELLHRDATTSSSPVAKNGDWLTSCWLGDTYWAYATTDVDGSDTLVHLGIVSVNPSNLVVTTVIELDEVLTDSTSFASAIKLHRISDTRLGVSLPRDNGSALRIIDVDIPGETFTVGSQQIVGENGAAAPAELLFMSSDRLVTRTNDTHYYFDLYAVNGDRTVSHIAQESNLLHADAFATFDQRSTRVKWMHRLDDQNAAGMISSFGLEGNSYVSAVCFSLDISGDDPTATLGPVVERTNLYSVALDGATLRALGYRDGAAWRVEDVVASWEIGAPTVSERLCWGPLPPWQSRKAQGVFSISECLVVSSDYGYNSSPAFHEVDLSTGFATYYVPLYGNVNAADSVKARYSREIIVKENAGAFQDVVSGDGSVAFLVSGVVRRADEYVGDSTFSLSGALSVDVVGWALKKA